MTESEAVEWIKELKGSEEILEFYYAESFIKACDMEIQALEKQIPKKPKKNTNSNIYFCSVCERKVAHNHALYCSGCGQKLDWSE